jgi:5-hydroxyisourate hydrolase
VSTITTHVLDTARGAPAGGVQVVLERENADGTWIELGRGATDGDGRLRTLVPDPSSVGPGVYRLTFATGAYFDAQRIRSFYPHVTVAFETVEGEAHYHVPLLVSPFGYSTYRGS